MSYQKLRTPIKNGVTCKSGIIIKGEKKKKKKKKKKDN